MGYEWDFDVVFDSLPVMLNGLGISAVLAVLSMIIGSPSASPSPSRGQERPGHRPASPRTVEFIKNTPLLAQLLGLYYALPIVSGVKLSAFNSALLALSLSVGVFMSEIFRAGILGVDRGQWEAASAIGLTERQSYVRIILPPVGTR